MDINPHVFEIRIYIKRYGTCTVMTDRLTVPTDTDTMVPYSYTKMSKYRK